MTTWKVLIDYDADIPADEQDEIDAEIDRLAESAGELIAGGSGLGFGRRGLDYEYEDEREAAALVEAVEDALAERVGLDLKVHHVAVEREVDW